MLLQLTSCLQPSVGTFDLMPAGCWATYLVRRESRRRAARDSGLDTLAKPVYTGSVPFMIRALLISGLTAHFKVPATCAR
jgi:hypothetical protein